MKLDMFDAYYLISEFTADGRPVLFGAARSHFVRVHADVCLIRLAKDELRNDPHGTIMCDATLGFADPDSAPSFLIAPILGYPVDTSGLHPCIKDEIEQQIADGADAQELFERYGAVVGPEFLGFTEEHVRTVRPGLFAVQEVEVDGAQVVVSDWLGGVFL